MKVYTVQRQNKIDYDCSVELLKLGCYANRESAVERAKMEYKSMQGEYEDKMRKYSDKDIYDPDEYDSGALFIEEDDGLYFISFGADEEYESHTVWVEEWEVE